MTSTPMRFASALLLLLCATTAHAIDSNSTSNLRGHGRRTNEVMKRVIVTYDVGKRESCRSSMMARSAANLHVAYEFDFLNAFVVVGAPDDIDALEGDSNIVAIEEDVLRYPTMFGSEEERAMPSIESSVRALADDKPYGIALVQADLLQEKGIRGEGVTVCVIDSGVDQGHEDLDRLSGFSEQSDLEWNQDGLGHGTHVTGTIAALANDIGVVGVAPMSSIYMVRVFGNEKEDFIHSSGLVDAANRCVAAGAKIINMSLGGPSRSNFEEQAFASFLSQGVLLIAAAGNGGNTDFSYPASYGNVLAVAAIDSNKQVASFSQRNSFVDIAGPGVDVRSTVPSNQYGFFSGTSMATPHVSGVAALLWSFKPSASATEIHDVMLSSALDLGMTGRDDSFGYGLVQALASAELLNGGPLDGNDDDGNDGDSACVQGEALIDLFLRTDQNGYQTTLKIVDQDGAVLGSDGGEPLLDNQDYRLTLCVPAQGCYTLTVFDSNGDGITGDGGFIVSFNGMEQGRASSFGSQVSIEMGEGCVP